jgi:NAD(P)-dependent dehydrogenase (short-subunit alcohol dehydrogenase family)
MTIAEVIKNKWGSLPKESTESFAGRIVLVTGATSGLGYAAAAKFARLGASKVIITARDEAKGESIKKQLEAEVSQQPSPFEVWTLDMNLYDSVVKFSQRAYAELDHLDVAILNIGVFNTSYRPTQYGWEEDLQVNTFSTSLLGILLLPKLKESQKYTGKIPILQFVNSSLHKTVEISAEARDSPNILVQCNKPDNYTNSTAQIRYGYSKLFLRMVAVRLAAATPSNELIITSVCPGIVFSNIHRHIKFPGFSIIYALAGAMFFRTADQGANTYISGASQNQELHGRFWASDVIENDAQSLVGEENQKLMLRVWDEIMEELGKHVPDIKERLQRCGME